MRRVIISLFRHILIITTQMSTKIDLNSELEQTSCVAMCETFLRSKRWEAQTSHANEA